MALTPFLTSIRYWGLFIVSAHFLVLMSIFQCLLFLKWIWLVVFIYFYVTYISYIALGLQNSNYALVRGIKFNRLIPKTLSPNVPLDHQTHSVGFQKHDDLTYVAKYGFIKFGQHHDMFSTLALFMSILAMIIVMIIAIS